MDSNQSVSLSPAQSTPPPSATGISSFPIRAPLSSDSDFESALKTHTRSSSSSSSTSDSSVISAKSFESEVEEDHDGFLSGEDGFETASEKEALENNLELDMEGEGLDVGDDIIVPVIAKPVLGGSSSFSSTTPPKARVSGEDDDEEDDDDNDDGEDSTVVKVPIDGGIVEAPKVGVLEVEKEKKGVDGISGDSGIVVNGLVSEDKVPGVVEAFDEALAVSKEDVVPENPNLGSSENGGLESDVKGSLLEETPAAVEVSKEALVVSKEDTPVVDNDTVPDAEVSKEASVVSKEDIPVVVSDSVPDNVEVSKEPSVASKEDIPVVVTDSVPDVVEVSKEASVVSKEDIPVLVSDTVPDVDEVSKEALVDEVSKEALVESNEDIPVWVADTVPVDAEVANEALVAVKEDIPAIVADSVPIVNEVSEEALVVSKEDIPLLVADNVPVVNGVTKEALVPSEEDISVLDSGSSEMVSKSVPGVPEVSNEDLVASREDILPENPKLGVDVNSEIGEVETKNEVVQEEKSEEVGEKQEVFDEKDNEVLTSGTNQAGPEGAGLVNSEFVEEDKDVKLTSEGDLLVETKPIPLEPESGGMDVEENPTSETKPQEVKGGSFVDVGVVSGQSPDVIEEPDDSKTVEAGIEFAKADYENGELSASEKNVEAVESSAHESEEVKHQEAKTEAIEVQKDDDENVSSIVAKTLPSDADDKGDKPEFDGEKNISGDKLDGFGEAQSADSCTEPEEVNSVQEEKVPIVNNQSSDAGVASEGDGLEEVVSKSYQAPETAVPTSIFGSEVKEAVEDEVDRLSEYEEAEDSVSDEDNEELNFGSSGTAEQIMKELMRGSGVSFRSGAESSQDNSQRIDGQISMDSDEEVDTDEEGEGKELFDSAALAALLKAATSGGQEGGNVTITSQDGSRLFSVERPAGLGTSLRSKPASQPSRPNIFRSSEVTVGGEAENVLSEEEKKKLDKIQVLRVKFLRLLHRLGHDADVDPIAAQVLYRMVLAAGRQTGPAFSLETAKKTAMQLETEKSDDLDFSLNILVLGKTGVGKSATINSIFGEEKAKIGAFEPATTRAKEITGTVAGVKIRVLDTPGLSSSVMEQSYNRSILSSAKKWIKKFPVDILLYVDRLDTQTRDLNDLPLLKTITNTLGSSIWRSAVVTLTHAASAPPDGPSGSPLSYEVFIAQRSHIVQQSIGQAVGDLRMMNPSLMNPVTLAENHPSCRKNREGQRILPNGQIWRPQLLLLCYSLKVLSEVSSLSKPQDAFDHRKLFGFRVRAPPLPYLLSSLLQSRAHPKLPDDQGGDNVDSDIELEDLSDSDQEEEEDEYDQLPPFKPLRKAQIAKLSKDQKKAYFDEYDYRVKLLQKKQWKEELKRMKEMKKKGKGRAGNFDEMGEEAEQEGPAAVPVPLPDMVLPPSFDGDNPAYRYRFLEPTSQLLARPVLDTHGWDHDCGYDGVSLEENLAIAGQFPGGVAIQITKDKKEFNIHLDSSVAAKHGENVSTLAGFDIQTIGKQLGYIVRGETKFKNFKKNKTTGGVSVTFLGENVATGIKVEDQIRIGKRLTLVGSTGTIRSQGDAAYGANLEACLKEKDFPIGQDQSTLGLSLMKWRGDLALGANLQSQVSIGRSSKMAIRVGLNNKLSGQITIRTSSSEQLQLALVGILPIAISIYRSIWPSTGESYSAY